MIKSEEKRSIVVVNLENTANHCGSTHTHTHGYFK